MQAIVAKEEQVWHLVTLPHGLVDGRVFHGVFGSEAGQKVVRYGKKDSRFIMVLTTLS